MPEITLSLPAALGLLALSLTVGAVLVFYTLRTTGRVVEPTATVTITNTVTVTVTSTITVTPTIAPTLTPEPPQEYTVAAGDTCLIIAATFKVSVNSIILANNLPAACTLSPGQKLVIPRPTPTASPQPSSTLNPGQATEAACQKDNYVVQSNDTLSKIAAKYNVAVASIRDFNHLPNDTVYEGQKLIIPLCQRAPTAGPTPTITPPPPYQGPTLLLPADGAAFSLVDDVITLQWASVGTLRPDEAYAVAIEDVTDGSGKKVIDYVTDSKYIVPATLRPTDTTPHIFRWSVMAVRQTGTDNSGKATWTSAGAVSAQRVFSWSGVSTGPTPTPQ